MSRMNEMSTDKGAKGGQGDKGVGEQIRDMGGQVRDAAREKYEQLRDQAGEYYEEGRQRAQEWEQGLEHYVKERPIKSLIIAAGVGLAVGFLMRRS